MELPVLTDKEVVMRNQVSRLITAGLIGAGLMYYFDPDRGRRRRSLVRDQLVHAGHRLETGMETTGRDIRNRANGMWAWLHGLAAPLIPDDDILVERVRSGIGRVVRHPGSIEVAAKEGRVTLSGPILADEVDRLLRRVRSIYGVEAIANRLEVHNEAGRVPGLQGNAALSPGERGEFLQVNWSPAARALAGTAAGGAMIYGVVRGGLLGAISALAGLLLFARAATNLELRRLTGIGIPRQAIDVQKTIHINAPVSRVFNVWTDFESFPSFMAHVRRVRRLQDGRQEPRWRWTVDGPLGTEVEFDTVVTAMETDHLLAWRTEPTSMVQHVGRVQFSAASENATTVEIKMSYNPVAGALGHAVARLCGADPKHRMDDDLVRMKAYIETGKSPHDAAMHLARTSSSVAPVPARSLQ
jgi:uncharacterized membrane protein